MAVKDLVRVQVGKESTWGTAVAATSWLTVVQDASVSIADDVKALPAAGTLAPASFAVQTKQSAEGKIKSVLTYEDVLYPLFGIFGATTPTGAGPYTWTFTAPRASAPVPQAFTVEIGQTDAAYRAVGGLFSKLSLSLAAEEVGTWQCDVIAKALESHALTSSLSRRSQTVVRGADAALYIDPWTGTIGSTPVAATLIESELSIDTGRHLKFFADGSIQPAAYGESRWKADLKLTAEFNASAKALVDALLSGVVKKLIRIRCMSGTNQLTLDFAGVLTDGAQLWKDRDGNLTVELTFTALDAQDGPTNYLSIDVVNDVAALP